MRMVPAGNLGEPLGRALRDACKRTGKQARLVVEGGEVQLDRHVLEELKGPLIHLVRNAIDHGIEEPEVREAIGKPARARVELVVRQELRTLHVEVRDDGRGVDVEAAREQARVRGLVSDAEAERLDEAQVIDLLFRSGFSTAAEVTELSGRGVGLDVVRDAATRLQGSASMTSTMGRGSAVHLTVPLTVAAHSGIVVEERGRRFALPLAQVERVVRATAAELRDDGARTVFDLDDEPLPIARLSTLLDAPARGGKSAVTILVARAGEGRVGIVCERLIGQRELLLRPLPTELSTLDHISGVALLPSGEAIFVLSPVVLARQPQQRRKTTPSAPRERAVLIADDSITIRSLLRHALEAAGFRVRTATDGEEALQLAGLERFDLVVADVRMPRVDGLQLTARLRASPRRRACRWCSSRRWRRRRIARRAAPRAPAPTCRSASSIAASWSTSSLAFSRSAREPDRRLGAAGPVVPDGVGRRRRRRHHRRARRPVQRGAGGGAGRPVRRRRRRS